MKKDFKKKKKKNKDKETSKLPESQHREITGIFVIVLAFILFFSLSGGAGSIGEYANFVLIYLFGIGGFLIPLVLLGLGVYLFFIKIVDWNYHRVLGVFIIAISILSMIALNSTLSQPVNMSESYLHLKDFGGIIGFTFAFIVRVLFGDGISWFIFIASFISGVQLVIGKSYKDIYDLFFKPPEVEVSKRIKIEDEYFDEADIDIPALDIIKPSNKLENTKKHIPISTTSNPDQMNLNEGEQGTNKPAGLLIKKKDSGGIKIKDFTSDDNWVLPSLDLLSSEVSTFYPDDELLKSQAELIKSKLSQFGLNVEVVSARVGPTVTQFTLKPDDGVKISKISGAKNDLALALSARSLRIEAPIPGQPYVGIEIPNKDRSKVFMKEVLASQAFISAPGKMKLSLGKDVSGNSIIEHLDKMPHVLIAGSTNSGKSVCINSFIISLLYQNSPKELKFIMIDPKMVELTPYNGIPHLLTPVIAEPDKALSSLKWALSEMMRRYNVCKEKGHKNLAEYNAKEEKKMPRIVIIIDELAELMMRGEYKKDTENAISRLAQMARAVGIHLMIATQRPSVNVVTGLIKANIPTRISFYLLSQIDSRTVLDSPGAEDLLGFGDMLYINATTPKPVRIQGIYVSTEEIEKVTTHVKLAREPELDDVEEPNINDGGLSPHEGVSPLNLDLNEATMEDDLIPQAIEVIRKTRKASATLFQRMLSVGYARAAKILDILEKQGFVGPANGAKPRELYIDKLGINNEGE